MKDIILISKGYKLEYFDTPLEDQPEGSFQIHYVRLADQASLNHLLQKNPIKDLPSDKVKEFSEIEFKQDSFGSLSIDTEDEAIEIAKANLSDPSSNVRKAGFDESTILVVVDLDKDIARIVT